MDIIGSGFIARHMEQLSASHPGVVTLASGVSHVNLHEPEVAFARESRMVREVAGDCARRGGTLLFFSTASAAVYGAPGCSGHETCRHPPGSPYGRHKLGMERIVRESGCKALILRLGHLVGPDQSAHQLLPNLVGQVLDGSVRLFRKARRDLLDVEHFVRIVDDLLTAGVSGETVNVASGRSVPVEDIVAHLAHLLARQVQCEYVERSSDHQVSVRKLQRLLPGQRPERGPVGHYRSVLDRYARHYVPETYRVS